MRCARHRALVLVLVLIPTALRAEETSPKIHNIEELSLEDLLNVDVKVATHTTLTMRDAPGIITVVTRDEIVRSGARDLMDILLLVPGFSIGLDVQGVVDVGFRGNWGHEGKVLFLLDGQELNETLYATMQLGMHIPAAHIQRVEIIRGPGSVIYGGYAELAVVNIITRDSKALDGAPSVSTYYGQMAHGMGRFMASASYGQEFKQVPGLGMSLELYYGNGNRSDRTYQDFSGASYPMLGNSQLEDFMLNYGLHYRDLQLRFIYDDYLVQARDGTGPVMPTPAAQRFEGYFLDARYDAHLAHNLTLTPRLTYKRQTPWQVLDKSSPVFYDKTADRLRGGLMLTWDPIRMLSILAGAEGYWDHGHVNDPTLVGFQTLFPDNSRNANYGDVAGYAQIIFKNFIANVTLGARYEYNTAFGSSFVPRVGLTKTVGRFNFKLLYSQAFRAPSFENIDTNPKIQPERTNIVEGEAGVQMTDHMALTINGYWMRIDKPIVYTVDLATNMEEYLNSDHVGTSGVEADYRIKYTWGFFILDYSFYSAAGQNAVPLYTVPTDSSVLLAMPAHKVSLDSSFDVWRDHVTLGLSGAFMSTRYGYEPYGASNGVGVIGLEPSLFLVNANVAYRNLLVHGLDVMVGAFNLLDQHFNVPQSYNGGHAPLPMASREVFVRLSYGLR